MMGRTQTGEEVINDCLLAPFIAYVSGPPLSGKTQFVMGLLDKNFYLIDPPPDHIVWFYGEKTAQIGELTNRGYEIVKGLPTSEDFEQYIFPGKNNLFVFDDLMEASGKSKGMTDLVTNATTKMSQWSTLCKTCSMGDLKERPFSEVHII